MAQKQNVDTEELKLVERWDRVTANAPREPLNRWTVRCKSCIEDVPISTGNIGTFEHTCADGTVNHIEIYWPGHTPGKDPDLPPPSTDEQVNALQAQVGFCQGYIVELEKQLRRFMPDMDQHEDLSERVGKSLEAHHIICDINTELQVELRTIKEKHEGELQSHRHNYKMLSGIIKELVGDDWHEWTDKSNMIKEYLATQRNMREDNANLAAQVDAFKDKADDYDAMVRFAPPDAVRVVRCCIYCDQEFPIAGCQCDMARGVAACPHDDPLHLNEDGCPTCRAD